jgi:DNA-binding protein H-NS
MNLDAMSIESLVKLRDNVTRFLSQKAIQLQRDLAALGADYAEVGRIAVYGRPKGSALKGRKVAAKYRGPDGETWAGRGARPRWLAALLKEGHKLEEYAISPAAPARKRAATKRGRPAKKRREKK